MEFHFLLVPYQIDVVSTTLMYASFGFDDSAKYIMTNKVILMNFMSHIVYDFTALTHIGHNVDINLNFQNELLTNIP